MTLWRYTKLFTVIIIIIKNNNETNRRQSVVGVELGASGVKTFL